ncbi:MAG: hypothetical protein ISR62_03860 [Desulfobacteraceae bacterium]|nr:hypothetical protein [Desulfobacterales bacterium]MBL6967539.1 hypothetical protein [Desulfobacteraceae bacterium]
MKISESYRKIITDEIDYVESMMNKAKDVEEKLYFFSAIQGTLQRIFNLEYDSELVFIQVILQHTHVAFLQRLQAVKNGDLVVPLLKDQIEQLIGIIKELSGKISGNKKLDGTLKKFAILAYSTTGNGYYLLQKGLLKIKE